MTREQELRRIYETYREEALEVERNRKIGDGLFGLGKRTSDDPCHERFHENLERFLRETVAADPPAEECAQLLRYIYQAPEENREPQSVYWMLLAVHGLTKELAGKLDPETAASLRDSYGKTYPRWKRLPAQNELFRALKQAASR